MSTLTRITNYSLAKQLKSSTYDEEQSMKKLNLNKIVEQSCNEAGLIKEKPVVIEEAIVATAKKYTQVSETTSQKSKDAHIRLYQGSVESLNRISAELDSVSKDADSLSSNFRRLKLDETYNLNAVWLHELYFANCFDPHSEIFADSLAYLRLARDFGTFEDWQRSFIACALSAREGWAVCGYNIFLKKYVNTVIDSHAESVMMGVYPVIVLDMWSHSYNRDYLDDKHSYVVAQMRELNWTVINDRFLRSERIGEALK
jgi:Fe-Mn family superoxide dismutase